jgi:hypothetical protein
LIATERQYAEEQEWDSVVMQDPSAAEIIVTQESKEEL